MQINIHYYLIEHCLSIKRKLNNCWEFCKYKETAPNTYY